MVELGKPIHTYDAAFVRDGHIIVRRADPGERLETLDHVVPRSRGGAHAWDNVVAACRRCNLRKSDRLLEQTQMVLRRRPTVARRYTWIITSVGAVPEAWEQYLQAA